MTNTKSLAVSLCCLVMLIIGIALTGLNILGLYKDIRPESFLKQDLRFDNDVGLTFEETMVAIRKAPDEAPQAYAERLSRVISQGLAHVEWKDFEPTKYNQLIPIWENYFLYFMGIFSGIPEYERYHFSDYTKSLERGIGICGDASMIMSQLLDEQGIDNQLITFPGHVIVAARFDDGSELTYDPDFGVAIGRSPADIQLQPNLVNLPYAHAGYGVRDLQILNRIYSNEYKRWNGVQHFITKKHYFEIVAYWLKWPFPLALIFFSLVVLSSKRRL